MRAIIALAIIATVGTQRWRGSGRAGGESWLRSTLRFRPLLILGLVSLLGGLALTSQRVEAQKQVPSEPVVPAAAVAAAQEPSSPVCQVWREQRKAFLHTDFIGAFNAAVAKERAALRAGDAAVRKGASASTQQAQARLFFKLLDQAIAQAAKLAPITNAMPRLIDEERQYVRTYVAVGRDFTSGLQALRTGADQNNHALLAKSDALTQRANTNVHALWRRQAAFDHSCS